MKLRLVLLMGMLSAAGLMAQTFRGTILGTVTDPSGAVIAGAKVTVRNTNTGLERTSADGRGAAISPFVTRHSSLLRIDARARDRVERSAGALQR